MSIQFSDTTNYDGLIQFVERTLGFPRGYISGNTDRLKEWTAELNLALDKVMSAIFSADGRYQFDDGNHTTYPILTGNLVDGQRDYSFTEDADANLVLKILRVFVRTSTTTPYYEIFPVDVQSDREDIITNLADGMNTKGRPDRYDLTATGIFLDPIPSANVTAGLKVYVSREGSYFTTADTTKKPGYYGLYHEYLILDACYRYARANRLEIKGDLSVDLLEMKKEVVEAYSKRNPHDTLIMQNEPIIYE